MKQNEKLSRMMNALDERYIEEAEKTLIPRSHFSWKKITAIAASFVLVAGICTLPFLGGGNEITHEKKEHGERYTIVWNEKTGSFTYSDGTPAHIYVKEEDNAAMGDVEIATKPVIDIVNTAKPSATQHYYYPYMADKTNLSYVSVNGSISEGKIGEKLFTVMMANDKAETVRAELYEILGIEPTFAVAVRYEDTNIYYPYTNSAAEFASFADYKSALSLATDLYMGNVLVEYNAVTKTETYRESEDMTTLKNMLLSLDGTPCTYDEYARNRDGKRAMAVSLAHATLRGIGGQAFQLFEDGYLFTNLGGTLRIFKVDEEDARDILDYAEKMQLTSVKFYEITSDVFENDPIIPGGNSADNPETTAAEPYMPKETETEHSGAYIPGGLTTPSYDPDKEETHEPASTLEAEDTMTPTETEIALETMTIPQ